MRDVWRWLYALVRGRSVTSRLPTIYSQFSAVDTLSFLQKSFPSQIAPRCRRLLASDAMWTAFAPRLRELNLTVNLMEDLDLIFPPPGYHLTLPRLEVLRFAYFREWLSTSDTGAGTAGVATGVAYMVALLGSTRATLRTLQIHLHYYVRNGVILITELLPEDIKFPQLRRFDFVLENSPLRDPPPAHQSHIRRFIDNHAATLRIIKLGRLVNVVNMLVDDPPAAFIHDSNSGDQPRIVFSLELPPTGQIFDSTAENASLRTWRSTTVSLSLYSTSGMKWPQFGLTFHNLRHLSLDWTRRSGIGVKSFLPIARHAPNVISLGVRHSVCPDSQLGMGADDGRLLSQDNFLIRN